MQTVRELIKAYRACTTKSEERALVKKEAAHIRDLFREGDKAFRRRNIAKLLFFHMNGYPTDFGMTECIKLCASNKYNDKRVAYLGLMILVDETEEILMLMTNCLKQDLHSDELQIVSLALNVLGNIASEEMVRDLLPEIEKHLLSQNPYIRKKAALAAVRAVRKLTPEETINILRDVPVVFDIKSPAVHISAAALVSTLCRQDSANIAELQMSVAPPLLNILRDHLLKKARGNGTEPVIGGIRNPFLQVKLIAALRLLVQSGAPRDLLEHISDVLAQVAANTASRKVAGCAVLYECIKTITSLNTERSLRELAVNICGQFLSHKEPTVRYIALQELTRIVEADGPGVLVSVDGYKEKVLAGMREADPTVRKRAVELAYRIANESNIDEMVTELLGYIEKSSLPEAKEDTCWKIFMLLDRFGPSDEWKVETFVKTLSSADMCMPEEIITSFIALVSAKPHVQGHAVLRLFSEALTPQALGGMLQGDNDLNSSRQGTNGQQSANGASHTAPQKRKPRLERVALYVLGEHGEVTPNVGLDIPQVLDAFENMLRASEAIDEPWMNTYEIEYHTENKVLGEVALTGLVKFACRAVRGSSAHHSMSDPILSLAGSDRESGSDPLSSVLAIKAPPQPKSDGQDLGLGTDLLASMGLGEDKPKGLQNGNSLALVPGGNSLGFSGQGNAGALMSLEPESSGSGNPVIDRVRHILLPRARDSELETQQRACEYLMLLNESLIPVLESTMAPMPPLDFQRIQERARQRKELRSSKSFTETSQGDGLLLDLLGESGGAGPAPLALPAGGVDDLLALPPSAPRSSGEMTLEDIMGGSASNAPPGQISVTDQNTRFDLDTLAGTPVAQTQTESNELGQGSDAIGILLSSTIFESNALLVSAQFFRDDPLEQGSTRAELLFTNKSGFLMKNFVFLLAVPKYIQLQMQPASASEIPVGGHASQGVNLINCLHHQKPIQLRYRVKYENDASGEHVQEQGVATGLEAL